MNANTKNTNQMNEKLLTSIIDVNNPLLTVDNGYEYYYDPDHDNISNENSNIIYYTDFTSNDNMSKIIEPKQENIWKVYFVKLFIIIFSGIYILPFAIFDLYFAWNEKKCMNDANKYGISIYQYLLIYGIYNSILYITIFLNALFQDTNKKIIDFHNYNLQPIILYHLCFIINTTFVISWTILGCIVYYSNLFLYNFSKCDKKFEIYMNIQFISKMFIILYLICYSMNIIDKYIERCFVVKKQNKTNLNINVNIS
jgi:hypothetical protein